MEFTDSYSEIKKIHPFSIRGHLRNAALTGLSLIDKLNGIGDQLKSPKVQFLYIHHVFKDEEKKLHQLLATLQKYYSFISYSEAVDRVLTGNIDRSYIALSSDDGFKNNVKAAEILNEFDAKACFFINPSLIGEPNYDRIRQHCEAKLHFPPVEFLNWEEVNVLQKMGHEIGSHTMEHINVAKTPADEVFEDMRTTFAVLKRECGEAKHFAYPYGRFFHFNETGRKACFEAGFISCASAERGCHVNYNQRRQKEELCILRDHIVLDWNINHILYFLSKGSRRPEIEKSFFNYAE